MSKTIDLPGVPNLKTPEAGYACGGQPSPEQLVQARQAGLERIINLRPASEDAGYDEAAKAKELGLEYHVIGIASGADLNHDNVKKLDALLGSEPAKTTFIHCKSGNRVGALMALRAAWLQGKPAAEAIETGKAWGLTSMEAGVQQLLG
ncbi:MAG: sulfur transferase domain-containing protein [Sinobacteraceae bacterium]|nr:sulfur transferase domain-containing protein [Nevskiaceae bacterium]